MSISIALNNALSGLTASSRGVEIVSDNVANAHNPSYAARELVVSSRTVDGTGSGVKVDGVVRRVDEALRYDRTQADAALAYAETTSDALGHLNQILGDPTEPGGLSQRVAQLSADLLTASSRPDSTARLETAVRAAASVTSLLNDASDDVQSMRLAADRALASDVSDLNFALADLAAIDQRIVHLKHGGRDITGLLDQRQATIDRIAPIVPVRELPRSDGSTALYTTGGAILYDGRASAITFTPANITAPGLTVAAGDLSQISINGVPYGLESSISRIEGGRLHANLQIRDQIGVEAQASLDALARDLIERFADPGADATRALGDPGLFTDGSGAFDPLQEVGVSARIRVNDQVHPDAGGEVYRLRDGLNATAPGNVGNSTLLSDLQTRLSTARTAVSGPTANATLSTAEFAAELHAHFATQSLDGQRTLSYETSRHETLREAELRNGVDTDDELRKLLVLEQAYAANARIISVIDEMMDNLLRL